MKKIMPIILIVILVLSGIGANALSLIKTKSSFDDSYGDEYDMVIIAPNKFTSNLQPLLDHKNNVGIATFIKTTDEIYNEYEGRDQPEQIKYFIKDAVESYGIKYVLLVGGRKGQSLKWYVPVRYSNVDDGFMHKQILSDLYYADIYKENGEFEDWDSNGNGVFSEWSGDFSDDSMDLIPDVYLGRLPCRYIGEVTDIVSKIIHYENNLYGHERFHNILLVGGDTNPGIGEPFPYEGEETCRWILRYLDGFEHTTLFTSDHTLTEPQDFISAFNNGYGLVLYHGHGSQDTLATYMPNSTKLVFVFHNDYIPLLTNQNMYPVMVVGCCSTTEFDVGIFNFFDIFNNFKQHHSFRNIKYECVSECLSWNMVKKIDGGSIAFIGSSSTAWGHTGDDNNDSIPDSVQFGDTAGLCTEFFRIFGEDDVDILGTVYANTLTNIIVNTSDQMDKTQCKCIQEFQLIGDPSLKIGGYP